MTSQLSTLLWKEFHQFPRKKGAVATAFILPVLILLIMPIVNMVAMSSGATSNVPIGTSLPPGLASLSQDPTSMIRNFTMPLFVTISGLMLPSLMATYTIINERERRTIDLLVALPVSVQTIVLAKLILVLVVAVAIALPLLTIDLVIMFVIGLGTVPNTLVLIYLLVAGLAYSTAAALVIGLLTRDYRTANNLNGAFLGPLILVSMAALTLLPEGIGPLVLGSILLALTVVVVAVALKWLTFDRLLR